MQKILKPIYAVLLSISLLLPLFLWISVVRAEPQVIHDTTISLPVRLHSSNSISEWLKIYIMYNASTNMPVYCTKKGSTLPTNQYELSLSDISSNPELMSHLSAIYNNGRNNLTTSFSHKTPNNNSISYSAIEQHYGYITNQLAIWMLLGKMGYQSGNLVGGIFDGNNLYDAYVNHTIYYMNETQYEDAYTSSAQIPDTESQQAMQSMANELYTSYCILRDAKNICDSAMNESISYTSGPITCELNLSVIQEWEYFPSTDTYEAEYCVTVTNGGTWEMASMKNISAYPTSGSSGDHIRIICPTSFAIQGADALIRAVKPDQPLASQMGFFTSNGQSFITAEPPPVIASPEMIHIEVPMPNGSITIRKISEVAIQATVEEVTNPKTNAKYDCYQCQFDNGSRDGAVFQLRVGPDDICHYDGTPKQYHGIDLLAGTVIHSVACTRNSDSENEYQAIFSDLPLDDLRQEAVYIVEETACGDGDLLNAETMTITLSAPNQSIHAQADFVNERQRYRISVLKRGEEGQFNTQTLTYQYNQDIVEGAVFGLYSAHDICSSSGEVIVPHDAMVDLMVTDAYGVAISSRDIPRGEYYVKELSTTDGLVLSETEYYLNTGDALSSEREATIICNQGAAIVNKAIKGVIAIYKTTSDTQLPMEGVIFKVYNEQGVCVDEMITNEEGRAESIILPYGKYHCVETVTWNDYILAEPFTVDICESINENEDYHLYNVHQENDRQGSVQILKRTKEGGIPMSGVTFAVYVHGTDEKLSEASTNMYGFASFSLPDGQYDIVETSTWASYTLQDDPIIIEIYRNQCQEIVIENEMTEMFVYKESRNDGTRLPEMSFTITDEQGNPVLLYYNEADHTYYYESNGDYCVMDKSLSDQRCCEVVTDAMGTSHIAGLPYGQYTITEIVAPFGYLIDSDPQKITIDVHSAGENTPQITMLDSKIVPPTTQTGEKLPKEIIIMALCLIGSALTIELIRIERKKYDIITKEKLS